MGRVDPERELAELEAVAQDHGGAIAVPWTPGIGDDDLIRPVVIGFERAPDGFIRVSLDGRAYLMRETYFRALVKPLVD